MRRRSFGRTMVISNANTFRGTQGESVAYRFLVMVYFKEQIYVTDPTVLNEPFVPDTGGA